jgi:MoaA/NifB/PqqE/SkfB family radical SAM enzyme
MNKTLMTHSMAYTKKWARAYFGIERKPKPNKIILYLTRRCDLRCPHCQWILRDENFFENFDMKLEDAKNIIDYHKEMFSIGGIDIAAEGEVLLYKELKQIVCYANKKGLKIGMTTNGSLLDRYSDFFLRNLKGLTVSIDGYDAPTYIEHRGGTEKHYFRVMENVRKFISARNTGNFDCQLAINCIVGRFNLDYIKPMIKLAEELGVDRMRFGNYHPTDEDTERWGPLNYGDPDVEALYREILSRNDYRVDIVLPSLYGGRKVFRCAQLFEGVVIGAKGQYSPCCHNEPDLQYGDYFKDPTACFKGPLAEFRKKFDHASKLEQLPTVCQQCPRMSPERAKYSRKTGGWALPESESFQRLVARL